MKAFLHCFLASRTAVDKSDILILKILHFNWFVCVGFFSSKLSMPGDLECLVLYLFFIQCLGHLCSLYSSSLEVWGNFVFLWLSLSSISLFFLFFSFCNLNCSDIGSLGLIILFSHLFFPLFHDFLYCFLRYFLNFIF